MSRLPVLVLAPEPEVYVGPLRDRLDEVEIHACASYEELEEALKEHRPTVVLASKVGKPFPRDLLFAAESVEWIQCVSAGVDHLLPLSPRVRVTSASGIHDDALADYVVCAVLSFNLHFPRFFRQQLEHVWKPAPLVPTAGQTLVVVGLGSIGTLAAKRARKLGMRVIGVKARPENRPEEVDDVVGVDRLREAVAKADVVAVTLPLTPETRGLFDARVLGAMKSTAVLVNISRGGIVDEGALAASLREGRLGGAVLDVFATEPLPKDSELWDLPNTVITPHTGDIEGWQQKVVELFCDNLARWRAGEELLNLVDPARGY